MHWQSDLLSPSKRQYAIFFLACLIAVQWAHPFSVITNAFGYFFYPWVLAALFWCLLTLVLFWLVLWSRRAEWAGRLLLDISRKAKYLQAFLWLLGFAVTVLLQVSYLSEAGQTEGAGLLLLAPLYFGACCFFLALDSATWGRWEFREGGIFYGIFLVRWEKIDSWYWQDTELIILTHNRLVMRQIAIKLPASARTRLTEIFKRKLDSCDQI